MNPVRQILATASVIALTACGGPAQTHGPADAPAALPGAPIFSVTLSRPTTTTAANVRSAKQIPAATQSIEADVWIGAGTATAPTTMTCTPFPSTQQSVTIPVSVPIGIAAVRLTAFSGGCSGAGGSGTALSAFSGRGTVTLSSTSFAAVFNAGRAVALSPLLVPVPDVVPPANGWLAIGPRNYYPGYSGKFNSVVPKPNGGFVVAGGFGQGYEVGTEAGVYTASSAIGPWQQSNTGLTDSTVNALLPVDAAATTILAATQFGGLFRSVDGGTSWQNVWSLSGAYNLAADAHVIYAGLTNGVAESIDGGATWTQTLTTSTGGRAVTSVGGTTLAGMTDGSIYRKSAGSWSKIASLSGASFGSIHALAVDPATPTTVLCGINALSSLPPFGTIYTQALFRSLDAGSTWTAVALPSAMRGSQILAASPTVPHEFYVGGTSVYTTLDAGATFTLLSNSGDARGLVVRSAGASGVIAPGGSDILYVASDQGLQIFQNHELSFVAKGIANNVIIDLAVSGSTILTAVQDYAPLESFDGGTTWQAQTTGPFLEDGEPYIHPASSANCYLWDAGGYGMSFDGCRTFVKGPTFAFPTLAGAVLFAGDPTNANILYVATSDGIQKSVDAGRTFAVQPWPVPSPESIRVGADGRSILVESASAAGRTLYVSNDAGATFAQSNLTVQNTLLVVQSPRDPSVVIVVSTGGSAAFAASVYRSTDGGLSFQPLSNAGLTASSRARRSPFEPALPPDPPGPYPWSNAFSANTIGSASPYELCIATDAGTAAPWLALTTTNAVYVSTDYGEHWHDVSGNAISRAFYGCAWRDNRLFVSTAGQGVLESVPLF